MGLVMFEILIKRSFYEILSLVFGLANLLLAFTLSHQPPKHLDLETAVLLILMLFSLKAECPTDTQDYFFNLLPQHSIA